MVSRVVRSAAKDALRIIEGSDGEHNDPITESFRATKGEKSAYRLVSSSLGVSLSLFIRDAILEKTRRLSGKT